ncbi:MAG TPA: LON peptidase substrate-binding domain-containing protein [Candidatus Polarisedimenticolaceae bacterium]|nr:LON peptidase substrate-binding domain-containing protein [Candidatus Polarisedimenticolaceae bacterium]
MAESRVLPVFPLPDVVFFPKTVLPLHVFEMRYRSMVRDALAADRTIAVALLQPGWERDYAHAPAYFPVATAGRMDDVETTADGRFYFRLSGLCRVRLGEVVRDSPYRLVRASEIPERTVDDADAGIHHAKLDLIASQVCLVRELTGREHPAIVLDEGISFEAAVNGACAGLPTEPAARQALLELDDLLERQRRAAAILDEILGRVLRLKAMRSRDEGESGPN